MNELLKLYLKQQLNKEYLEWFSTNEIQIKNKIKELLTQNLYQEFEELDKIVDKIYNEEKLDIINQLNSIDIDIKHREQEIDLNRNKEM